MCTVCNQKIVELLMLAFIILKNATTKFVNIVYFHKRTFLDLQIKNPWRYFLIKRKVDDGNNFQLGLDVVLIRTIVLS